MSASAPSRKLGERHARRRALKALYDNMWARRTGSAPFFTNDGEGRIYGMRYRPRSARRERPLLRHLSSTLSAASVTTAARVGLFDSISSTPEHRGGMRLGRGWEAAYIRS